MNDSDHHNDKELALSSVCFLSVIAVVTTVANGILLLTLIADPIKKLRTPPMYLITNLVIADIITGIVVDTFYGIYSISDYLGKTYTTTESIGNFTSFVTVNVAMWTRVALMCERYLCIKKPFRHQSFASPRNIVAACGLIWIYSTTFGVIGPTQYAHDATYRLIEMYFNVGIPALVMAVLFHNLYIFHRRQKYNDILKFRPFYDSQRNEMLTKAKQDKKMLNTVIMFLVLLLCTCVPYAIVVHINVISPSHDSLAYDITNRFSKPLIYMNSGLNPFIYAWRLNVFKRSMKHIVCKNRIEHGVVETRSTASVISRQRSDISLM